MAEPDFDPPSDLGSDARGLGLQQAILDLIAIIPDSQEPQSPTPRARAEVIRQTASTKAAWLSAAMSLPPGPFGWLAMLPELIGVWRVQAQMVADIANTYGQRAALSQSAMVHCLFRHATVQALRDVAVRAGERFLIANAQRKAIEVIAGRVGRYFGQRNLGRAVARWLPVVGAGAAAFYARADTRQVGDAAIELFESLARDQSA